MKAVIRISFCLFFFFFLRYWGLNSGPTPCASLPALFCEGFFWDRGSQTICLGWLQTAILLISAFWVARITGVSHQRQTGISSKTDTLGALALPYPPTNSMLIINQNNLNSTQENVLADFQTVNSNSLKQNQQTKKILCVGWLYIFSFHVVKAAKKFHLTALSVEYLFKIWLNSMLFTFFETYTWEIKDIN
jgi:hypothetical protein